MEKTTITKNAPRLFTLLLAAGMLAGCGGGGDESTTMVAAEPELESSVEARDAALNCTEFQNPDKPPVLLVHGTIATGTEQFTVFYTPQLVERGFDVCIVTYPDRGLIDQQISAEYIVHALRTIFAETGRKVAMIGHSQGATMPRWALKHWASAREAVADFVLIAGPNHGTSIAIPATIGETLLDLLGLSSLPVGTAPEAVYQFSPDSDFVAVLNAEDETPGEVEYTNLYTLFDELVQPAAPVPTAALDFGKDNPKVANILLQDVCPGHLAEHLTIGTTDTLAFALALDAISNPGPADPERAGGAAELCGLVPIDLETLVMPQRAQDLLTIVAASAQNGLPDPHLASGEPPLKPYAEDDLPVESGGE